MPTQQPPRARLSHPGLREAHETLAETSVTRFATKRRESTDVSGVTDDEEMHFTWSPFKRLPQRALAGMEIKMINEVLFAHPPGKIFVENLRPVVDRLPERTEIALVQCVFPGVERRFEFLCCRSVRHRRSLIADALGSASLQSGSRYAAPLQVLPEPQREK